MSKNYVAERKATTVTAYPDAVEPKWQQQPYTYRTSSYTDPAKEAIGFVIKYSLWGLLSIVIAVGLALNNNWGAGTLLIVWGLIATVGYIVIFLLLSLFTPEGVAVVHEYYDYQRHKIDVASNERLEVKRLELRREVLLAGVSPTKSPALPPHKESPALPFWQPDEDFVQDMIGDELFQQPTAQANNAVAVLTDFVVDLYDNASELLRDDGIVNMQAGVTLPWSKRSEVPSATKTEIGRVLAAIAPPLFNEFSGGRVVRLNVKDYPTKQAAIVALCVGVGV